MNNKRPAEDTLAAMKQIRELVLERGLEGKVIRIGLFLLRDILHATGTKPNAGKYRLAKNALGGNARVDGLDDRLRVFCIDPKTKRKSMFQYLPHEASDRQITWSQKQW